MPQIPSNIKPQKFIALLRKRGFVENGVKGSHLKLTHPNGKWTQVAVHSKPIPTGTLRAILRQSGLTVKDLEEAR